MHHLSKLKIIEGLKLLIAFLFFFFCISPSLLDLSGNMYEPSYFNINAEYSIKIIVLITNSIFAFILFFIVNDQLNKLAIEKDFWQKKLGYLITI